MAQDTEVLLRLRRQYSKDEAIAACNKEISRLQFELGVEKSEVARLTEEVGRATSLIGQLTESNKSIRVHNKQLTAQQPIKETRKKLRQLTAKYNSLRSVLISNNLMPASDYYNIENLTDDKQTELRPSSTDEDSEHGGPQESPM